MATAPVARQTQLAILNTMKKIITHRFTITMVLTGLLMGAMTLIGGGAYPVAFGALWLCFAIALGFAAVGIKKDLNNG